MGKNVKTLLINNYPSSCDGLRNCPFCGSTPMWHLQGNDNTRKRLIVVQCGMCGAKQETGAIHQSTEWLMSTAVEKWNKRVR